MYIISMLMLFAIISDLTTYKIKNTITYSFMLAGLLLNFAAEGFKGLVFSLQGIMFPVVCLIVLYMMGVIGAGDVKLLSSVGALMGAGFTLNVIVFSFICGGVIAAFLILIRRNGIERLQYLILYIKCCIITMKLVKYADFQDKQNGSKFHFSIAVASGTAAAVLIGGFGYLC